MGQKKDQIKGAVSEASVFQQYSRSFMIKDIDNLMEKLRVLGKNTTERSTKANAIIDELGEAVLMGEAIFSPTGLTVQDQDGNEMNYRAQLNDATAGNPAPNPAPNPQHNDQDLTVSTSSMVSVR